MCNLFSYIWPTNWLALAIFEHIAALVGEPLSELCWYRSDWGCLKGQCKARKRIDVLVLYLKLMEYLHVNYENERMRATCTCRYSVHFCVQECTISGVFLILCISPVECVPIVQECLFICPLQTYNVSACVCNQCSVVCVALLCLVCSYYVLQ